MSYAERSIGGFLREGDKVTVDPSVAGALFPVVDWKGNELLQSILRELKLLNAQMAELTGEELNSDDYED